MPNISTSEEARTNLDWFLGKRKPDKVIVILCIILFLSLTLNAGFVRKQFFETSDHRNYHDHLDSIYQKRHAQERLQDKKDLQTLLNMYQKAVEEGNKNTREIEKLNFECLEKYKDCLTKKDN